MDPLQEGRGRRVASHHPVKVSSKKALPQVLNLGSQVTQVVIIGINRRVVRIKIINKAKSKALKNKMATLESRTTKSPIINRIKAILRGRERATLVAVKVSLAMEKKQRVESSQANPGNLNSPRRNHSKL